MATAKKIAGAAASDKEDWIAARRCAYVVTAAGLAASLNRTPVSSSDTSHSRFATASSCAAALQLEGEEQVGELRLPVCAPAAIVALSLQIVEVDLAHAMRAAAHRHDARVGPSFHQPDEHPRQREVPEMVRAELQLEAVARR